MPGPAQKEATRGCGTLQEARHGGDPAVEHQRWCSRSCSGLRVLGSSVKGQEGVAGAHRGSGRVETARRGRRRRGWRCSLAVRPCSGRCRGSPGLLVFRGGPRGHCKGITGFRSAYGPTAARNCLGIGSPAAEVQAEIRPMQGLCARMECPRDCPALRQDCYSAWPGLGGCGAVRARWCRARHGGAGRAGVLGFWGGVMCCDILFILLYIRVT